jgi:hypothetical protein
VNTNALWKLIRATHLGSSGRSKQQSLQTFLQWKQEPSQSLAQNFSRLTTYVESVRSNFANDQFPDLIALEPLFRMVFLLGLDQKVFQREIENAYDNDSAKSTLQLMEKCSLVHMERGGDSTSFVPTALAAPSIPTAKSRTLGPYPLGGNPSLTTCPFCHKNGYLTTGHGRDHSVASKRVCPFEEKRRQRDAAKVSGTATPALLLPKPPVPPASTALVVTPSVDLPVTSSAIPMSRDAAQKIVDYYATDGYNTYLAAYAALGLSHPDQSSLVAGMEDDDLKQLQASAARARNPISSSRDDDLVDSPVPIHSYSARDIRSFFPVVSATAADMSLSLDSLSVLGSDVSLDVTNDSFGEVDHVVQLQRALSQPTAFIYSAHDTATQRALAVASRLEGLPHVTAGDDLAPHLAFNVADPIEDYDDSIDYMELLGHSDYDTGTDAPFLGYFPSESSDDSHLNEEVYDPEAWRKDPTSWAPFVAAVSSSDDDAASVADISSSSDDAASFPSLALDDSDVFTVADDSDLPDLVDDDDDDNDASSQFINTAILDSDYDPYYECSHLPSGEVHAVSQRCGRVHSIPRADRTLHGPRVFLCALQPADADIVPVLVEDDDDPDDASYPTFDFGVSTTPTSLVASIAHPLSLSASIIQFKLDSCSSVHLTNDFADMLDIRELPTNAALGGVKGCIRLTHVGISKALAKYPPEVNELFYSAEAEHKLLSLGLLHRYGWSYASVDAPIKHTNLYDPARILFASGTLASNNLLLAPASLAASTSAPLNQVSSLAAPTSAPSKQVSSPALPYHSLAAAYDDMLYNFQRKAFHIGAQQRIRCDRVEAFHHGKGVHASDEILSEALHNGLFPELNITPQDVRLNRMLRGPCIHCAMAKIKQKPMTTSVSAPPQHVADQLHIDIIDRLCDSPGGKRFGIRMIDGFSGDFQYGSSLNKTARCLFEALMGMIHKRYTVYGHRVSLITSDPEPALQPVVLMLNKLGIQLEFMDPGAHEHKVENAIGYESGRTRAIVDALPYELPQQFEVYAEKWTHDNANGLPNILSRPTTPDILVTGMPRQTHYKYDFEIRFGTVVVCQIHGPKRKALAKSNEHSVSVTPKGEIGVVMGYADNVPGDFLILIENGEIVPRRVLHPVNCLPQVNGVQWKPKKVYTSMLSPPSMFPEQPTTSFVAPVPMYSDAPVASPPPGVFGLPDTIPDPFVRSNPPPFIPPVPDVVPSFETLPPALPVLSLPVPVPVLQSSSVPLIPAFVPPILPRQSNRSNKGKPYAHSSMEGYANVASTDSVPAVDIIPVFPGVFCRLPRASLPASLPDSEGFSYPSSRGALRSYAAAVTSSLPVVRPSSVSSACSSRLVTVPPLLRPLSAPSVRLPPVPRPRRSRPSQALSDEHAILDAAVLQARSEHLALIAVATEVDPLYLGPEEFLSDDTIMTACVSTYDMLGSSELRPIVDTTAKQIGLRYAMRTLDPAKITRTATAEIEKLMRIGCINPKVYRNMHELEVEGVLSSQVVDGVFVFKDKSDGRETARLTADGRFLPLPEGQISFSAVVPDDDRIFTTAMMIGHANSRQEGLNFTTCDVVGAFPRVDRPPNSPRLFIRLPKSLPHPLAGCMLEVKGAIYGLKESSRLFQLEMIKVLKSARFFPTESSPMTFISTHPDDTNLKSVASLVVDDIQNVDNCPALTRRLHEALRTRFTEITTTSDCAIFAGLEQDVLVLDDVTSVSTHQTKYIERTARTIGVTHMPPVTSLTMPSFYDASTLPADLLPASPDLFHKLVGHLVVVLKTRPEIRPFVSHLSRQTVPNAGDEAKAIYVLRYLFSTPHIRCVYNAMAPVIYGYSDSAFCCFDDGTSSQASILCVGPHDAPFHCSAKAQSSVAPDIVASEYYAVSALCLQVSHFRQLADNLGWPQNVTTIFMDSQSGIDLANAPIVTKKARHMKARYHVIREYVQEKLVTLYHIPSEGMRVDVITKLVSNANFLRGRCSLLNYTATTT